MVAKEIPEEGQLMSKILLVAFLAAATLAQAQTKSAVSNVQVNRNVQISRAVQVDPVVALQRQVAQLREQVKELRRQLDLVAKDSVAYRNSIAHCSTDYRQSSSNQGTRDCEPYLCDAVSGSCLMSCATSSDCVGGTNCNMDIGRCETVINH
jgi:cell division protein FtsB